MAASIVFSRIWVPLGNTGGTNVSPFKPMPIPDDLKRFLSKAALICSYLVTIKHDNPLFIMTLHLSPLA